MSVYPTGLDAFAVKVDNVDDVQAADMNSVQSGVAALQNTIGIIGSMNFLSSTGNIGSSGTPIPQIFAGTGNFHAVSGLSPILFLSDINATGMTITADTIYVNTIVSTGISASGNFVPTTGGEMTGNLIISGANIVMKDSTNIYTNSNFSITSQNTGQSISIYPSSGLNLGAGGLNITVANTITPTISGTKNLGSTSLPFGTIYTDAIVDNSNTLVRTTGATMSGNLNFSNADIQHTSANVFNIANDSSPLGITLSSQGGEVLVGNGSPSGGGPKVKIEASSAKLELGNFTGNTYALLQGPSPDTRIDIFKTVFNGMYLGSDSSIKIHTAVGSGLTLMSGTNLFAETSGTQNIGTPALPFSGVYALSVNDKVVIVSKVNEVPTGNISSGTNSTFTLTQSPYGTSLSLFKNGLLTTPSGLYAGVSDYVLSGSTITFGSAPISGSILLATYGYQA
jgi:hypothetical protein